MIQQKEKLFSLAREHGQEHIFRWWEDLCEGGRTELLSQAAQIDFDLVARLAKGPKEERPSGQAQLEPAPIIRAPRTDEERAGMEKARKTGEAALAAGKAAALLVAGGQATRLRFEHVKGLYPVGPVSGRYLFQMHAEKVLALSRRVGRGLPLYIMTSRATHDVTEAFFAAHGRFGLAEEDFFCIEQGMMPAVDFEGRILLEEKGRIAMSPNGHGGCLCALKESGALADMRRRGIEYVFFFHVDNPLVKVLDPVFLGLHMEAGAEMSGKVVPKRRPEEKVGVVGVAGGKLHVVEYINLTPEQMQARHPDGSLKYAAGAIGAYVLNLAFVERLNEEAGGLPWHRSRKAAPCIDSEGRAVAPKDKNAIKFETFVFDALPFARHGIMMEVCRNEEFAPIKNREGEDSPATALAMLSDYYAGWLQRAGVPLKMDDQGLVAVPVEINPLFALDEEELRQRVQGMKVDGNKPVYLR